MLSKREAEDGTNPALAASMTPEQVSAWPGEVIDGRTHPALWHMRRCGSDVPDGSTVTDRIP